MQHIQSLLYVMQGCLCHIEVLVHNIACIYGKCACTVHVHVCMSCLVLAHFTTVNTCTDAHVHVDVYHHVVCAGVHVFARIFN